MMQEVRFFFSGVYVAISKAATLFVAGTGMR
jgi:hypothetical protein